MSNQSPIPINQAFSLYLVTVTCGGNNHQELFFGHSYTAPTPLIHTLQQLGVSISKAFAKLLANVSTNCINLSDQTEPNNMGDTSKFNY